MDSSEFRTAAHAAIEEIIKYHDGLPELRVTSDVSPGYLKPLLPNEPPNQGEKWDRIQKDIASKIMPGLTHWNSPSFFAYFPASTSYPSMLGELYAAAFAHPSFDWTFAALETVLPREISKRGKLTAIISQVCSPAATELEIIVLDWLASLLNLPECYQRSSTGGGIIMGSASEAILTVMVAARDRYLGRRIETMVDNCEANNDGRKRRNMEKIRRDLRTNLVVLGSTSTHSSTPTGQLPRETSRQANHSDFAEKAAQILGVEFRAINGSIANNFAMTGEELRKTLKQCEKEGLEPFFLTATLGTTSTCAVDEFDEIKASLKDYPDLWVHVDAAYAGSALICPEYQHLTKKFASFDSFDFNMSKWLLVNLDASCLFVKNRKDLTEALSNNPPYLRNAASAQELVTNFRNWQLPLSRRFRSLKIWFVMRSYGIEGMQEHIRGTCRLGELFAELVGERNDLFEVLAGPRFALTVIRVKNLLEMDSEFITKHVASGRCSGECSSMDEYHRTTQEVCALVNERGNFFVTGCDIGAGIYGIRVVGAGPQTNELAVRGLFDALVETADEVRNRPICKTRHCEDMYLFS